MTPENRHQPDPQNYERSAGRPARRVKMAYTAKITEF